MPLVNIPGQVDYFNQKTRPGSGPFVPAPTPAPAPQPQPQPGPVPGSPMGGYIDRRAQANLAPKPPVSSPWAPYRPSPLSPIPGTAPATPTPSQGAPATPQPQPATAAAPVVPSAPVPGVPAPPPQAGQGGSTLQDPGQITAVGRAYADRIAKNLTGENPLVQNAQATEDTAAARRAYSARKGAGETLAQTPYSPGSAQYQRVMTEAQAGVDAANQAGQAGVNQLARAAGQDTLNAANALEDQQYARALGERTNRQQQDSQLGNTIEDPKARYAYNRMVAAGVDPKEAYKAVVGETGTINEGYRGISPVQQVAQDAADWVTATQPELVPGSPEFKAAVTARMREVDSAQRQPVTDAGDEKKKKDIVGKINSGEALTQDEMTEAVKSGAIRTAALDAIPRGSGNVTNWLKDNPSGLVSIDGKVYKVVSGGRARTGAGTFSNQERHTDYTEVIDMATGQKKYIVGPYNNKGSSHGYSKEKTGIYDAPPKSLGSGDLTPFGF